MPDVVDIDCSTGEVTTRSFTPEERAQREKDWKEGKEAEEKRRAVDTQRQKDLDAVKKRAEKDPDFAALVRLMKIDG